MDNNLKRQLLKLPLLQVLLHLHHRQMMRRKVEEVLMVLYRLHLDCREVERRRGFFLVVPLFLISSRAKINEMLFLPSLIISLLSRE